jgi:hypothetical protein
MELFHEAWSGLFSWAPPSVRLGIALALVVLVLTQVLPRLARSVGGLLAAGWTPTVATLTLPEFALTTASRRITGRPIPGAYGYGRFLGSVAEGGRRSGVWLQEHVPKKLDYPVRTVVALALLIVICWHVAPSYPQSAELSQHLNSDLSRVDTWLTTGAASEVARVSCTP